MLELERAQENILQAVNPLPPESVPLPGACGRFAAEDLLSPLDLPPFDNSAMDGYAVHADDLATATQQSPVGLQLAGQIPAGQPAHEPLAPKQCVRIFTGSVLPPQADAVVMQEDTCAAPDHPDTICFWEAVKPWENVRLRGEDVKCGSRVLQAGERLTVGRLSLLAATGISHVAVHRRPLVGLLATGNELQEAGATLKAGDIYESNRLTLAWLTAGAGGLPQVYPLVRDSLSETRSALEQAFAESDVVLTTGGVSVGELDFVKAAFEALGGTLDFWRVAIRPGKPFVFGRWQNKCLFGLPGNPISAFVTFLLLVRPALLRMQGSTQLNMLSHPGVLAQNLVNRGDRRHFMRVIVDDEGRVRSAGAQASHTLGSLAVANGLVDVPPQSTLESGTNVRVLRWET